MRNFGGLSMEEKLFGRTCPKCGEIYKDCQFSKIALGPGVQANMTCEQGHQWSEFYNLSYQGYWSDGKRYDSYGTEIKKYTD
jgi:hypothetical protein